jgi:hypothetical protein
MEPLSHLSWRGFGISAGRFAATDAIAPFCAETVPDWMRQNAIRKPRQVRIRIKGFGGGLKFKSWRYSLGSSSWADVALTVA